MDKELIKKQRISHLKEVKRLARKLLDANIAIQQSRKNSWERDVNKNNIFRLKSIITKTNKELHDQSINKFVEKEISQNNFMIAQNHFLGHPGINDTIKNVLRGSEIFKVLRYSPNYSIVYDLHWIEDGTVGDQMELAYGNASPNVYEKYCPTKIEEVRTKVIPYLSKNPQYATSVKLLKNITDQFQSNIYLSTNILLITVAESMVRQLCRYVYERQNQNLPTEEVQKYIDGKQSIESLIINDDWLNDIEILEAYMQSEYIDDNSLKSAVELIDLHKETEQEIREQVELCIEIDKKFGIEVLIENQKSEINKEKDIIDLEEYQNEIKPHLMELQRLSANLLKPDLKIKTSIKVKLQFLVGRFKEDRNSIIHGNYTDFDKGWKCYIYLTTIKKIWEIIKLYDGIHKKTA